jgi:hypothetical protein
MAKFGRNSFWQHVKNISKTNKGCLKDELKKRILKGIEKINADTVVHKWKEFSFLI